ncbi:MAG TPA: sugar ABC transporter permease [Candidatus Luteococcus avicola]|nr:sugar ABC transporter permease [Candidatus Luteococcus avicola]
MSSTARTHGRNSGAGPTGQQLREHRRPIEKTYLAMLIPAFILFTGLLMVPFATGLFYTFTNFKGYGDWRFIGLSNYISLFKDNIIWGSYWFTFKYAIVATILINLIALALALFLNEKIKGQTFWRGLFFLPNILPVLIVSYIFGYLFTNNLPSIGEKLGIDILSTSLLASEKYAWLAIVLVGVWQAVAYNTIIYLSGLQTIDGSVYEASAIDGATGWKKLSQITLPLIIPFVGINMVLSFKGSLGVFDQVVALTGGGPGTSTQSISYLIFKNGFQGGEYAYQTANGIIYFLIVVFLSLAQLRFFQSQERL